jgi:alpha-beta hydrolase superfamily lysophospholipase
MDLSQKQIETPQGRIAYFMTPPRAGAPVVLLLHGLSSNHTTWRPLMETLSARGFVCIAPDVRGHGHSDKTKRRSF